MKTELKKITPEWAAQILERLEISQLDGKFIQRNPRQRIIDRYCQDMKAGKWLVTHQGIAFDDKENLIDGQQRLRAVVKSGCTVKMLVTTGVPGNGTLTAMDVTDCGAARSVAQSFQVSHGYAAATAQELSITANLISDMVISQDHRIKRKPILSTAQALYIIESLGFNSAFERIAALIPIRKLRRGTVIAPLCWYYQVHPRLATEFATQFYTQEQQNAGSPPLMLFRWVMELSGSRRLRKSMIERCSVTASALQSFHEDGKIQILVPSKGALKWLVGLDSKRASQISSRLLQ